MKKTVAWMAGLALTLALTGCGDEGKDLSKVELSDIQEANAGDKLLDNHDTVSYKMEFRDSNSKMTEESSIVKDGDDIIYQVKMSESSTRYRSEVYKDGWSYSEFVDGDETTHEVFWYMDGEYDAEVNEYVRAFLVDDMDGLELTKREDGDEYYSVTAQVDEGDNVSEEYDYFYEYVVDKSSLEVIQFVAYALDKDEKQNVMSFAQVSYDEEYTEPSYVKDLTDAKKTRKVTVVTDPGKSSEKKVEENIDAAALFEAIAAEGYGVYIDKEGKEEYDVSAEEADADGNYGDLTVYLIKE